MFYRQAMVFARTISAFVISLSIGTATAFAQQTAPLPDLSQDPDTGPARPSPVTPAPVRLPPQQFQLAKDLDGLFGQLKRTADKRRAERIVQRIWTEWRTSDSRSVDLLVTWARAATAKKSYNQALDLLDQVVVLRPDYAEGFNQRATLHFLMEDYGKSLADIEQVLALEPRHFGAMAGLANIMERLDQKKRALEAWYCVLDVYPAMKNAQQAVLRLEEELADREL